MQYAKVNQAVTHNYNPLSEAEQLKLAIEFSKEDAREASRTKVGGEVQQGSGVAGRVNRQSHSGEKETASKAIKARDINGSNDEEEAIKNARRESILDEEARKMEEQQIKLLKCKTGLEAWGDSVRYGTFATGVVVDLESGRQAVPADNVSKCWNDYRRVIVGAVVTGCVGGALTVLGLVIEYTVFNT